MKNMLGVGHLDIYNLEPSSVKTYVQNHPKVLDEIILSLRTANDLRQLLQRKQSNILDATNREFSADRYSDLYSKYSFPSIRLQSETILKESKSENLSGILYNAAEIVASALQVDWFALYIPCHNNKDLFEYEFGGVTKFYGPIGKGMTVSAEAAFICETLLIENLPQDGRYPKGVGRPERDVRSVLAVPLVFPSGDLLGVIELCRGGFDESFGQRDQQICNSLLGWMVASLHESKINNVFVIQSKLNDFLMDTTKELFDDMISIDKLVENILQFSKDLVNADRCSMFLVNEEKKQLYADFFDEGLKRDGKHILSKKHQIRFRCDEGIAGHVYKTGEIVNITDAYRDPRFNPEIDKQTGYRTRNILCMPIVSKYRVVGVVQMINSLANDHFTHADEDAFKTYAVYCALALHYSTLYNQLQQSETQYKVAMDVLQYHIVAPEEEAKILKKDIPVESIPRLYFTYDFNPHLHEKQLPQLFIFMIHELFGKDIFDFNKLCRFIMTVRKNYRPLAYHNWVHGFNVAHGLYCMIKTNPEHFGTREAMALVIAGVCHDLDHRGYNNVFYEEFNLPLADLYGTSVMEHHHYKHAVTILQLEGHEIFSFLPSHEYKKMLLIIRDAIIATDLSVYFKIQKEVSALFDSDSFNLRNDHCKGLLRSLMMTAADLSVVTKPWDTQEAMVMRIYEEFYVQGDLEKECGLQPAEIMDRNNRDVTPKQQVGFIKFICQPLYTVLARILPGTKPLLQNTESNLCRWQKLDADRERDAKTKHIRSIYQKK
ncbi:cAMP and cAMP-inhibited cGMP 3',5'-cyclic phosphodiesterase 10A-like [Gigantopelta aegis]|uniref:cAMP and cAMP-inhibited cGMP 3',5'-cyclic phosphodiesterase 10A-like n=1 Tax=Gigantopelta aegis TaxID=1735272 RepID=UPI001B8878E1|nr:cAMP and cAMP-inhibited cGMP 3',5'-cyclic phosphodiesterase 10A-like [Gigantopelta aegis]